MANWRQSTQVVGGKTYPDRIIDSDKLLRMMAQMHFEKQAGADFTLESEINEKYEIVAYIFIRKKKSGETIINRFEKL